MPAIYRVQCSSCRENFNSEGVLAGWVITDGKKGGAIFPDSYLALRRDDGKLVPLPHPLESSELKRHGYSWASASRHGRLFRVTYKICLRCGVVHEECQHSSSQAGCSLALFLAGIGFLIFRFGFHAGWIAACFEAFLCLYLVFGIVVLVNWLRWRKENQSLKLGKCPNCQETNFTTIEKAVGKSLMCPICHQQTLHFDRAGIS